MTEQEIKDLIEAAVTASISSLQTDIKNLQDDVAHLEAELEAVRTENDLPEEVAPKLVTPKQPFTVAGKQYVFNVPSAQVEINGAYQQLTTEELLRDEYASVRTELVNMQAGIISPLNPQS